MKKPRSNCPQNLILEVIGDRWTLLIIRDMIINGKHYFREFMKSDEKIASNILAARLKMLEEEGIIHQQDDPQHKQKIRYSLTQKGIDLFPILMENARWSLKYKAVDPADAQIAQQILDAGPSAIQSIMENLAKEHLNS
ncbi:MAG: winged helix-turn-helix transcriptional regulator [Calditrichia bacterium]